MKCGEVAKSYPLVGCVSMIRIKDGKQAPENRCEIYRFTAGGASAVTGWPRSPPAWGHGKASRLKPLLQVRKNACGAGGYLWGRVYPGRRGWERHSRRSIVTPAGIKPAPHTRCGGAARRLGVSVGPRLSRPTGWGTTLRAGAAPPLAGLKP